MPLFLELYITGSGGFARCAGLKRRRIERMHSINWRHLLRLLHFASDTKLDMM